MPFSEPDIVFLPPAEPPPTYGSLLSGEDCMPFQKWSRRLGGLVDELECSDAELEQALHNKVAAARLARKRSRSFLGREFNRLSGEDPDFVLLTGAHFRQTIPLVKKGLEIDLSRYVACKMSLELAEAAWKNLVQRIEGEQVAH